MVVAGRCHERSTRSFRPDARRLARGLRAPSAHGSRLLRTAPVSERRCIHADHRSTRTTLEALTHITSSTGAPLQSGYAPFPCLHDGSSTGGSSIATHWHSARCTWRLARSSLTKGLRIRLLGGRGAGPVGCHGAYDAHGTLF